MSAPRLQDQVAVVTGGGRGIGRAIGLALDAEGARVVVHYGRDRAAAEATLARLTHPRAGIVQADLASPGEIVSAVSRLDVERVDILINNAGVWKPSPLGSTDEATVDELLHVNLRAPFLVT